MTHPGLCASINHATVILITFRIESARFQCCPGESPDLYTVRNRCCNIYGDMQLHVRTRRCNYVHRCEIIGCTNSLKLRSAIYILLRIKNQSLLMGSFERISFELGLEFFSCVFIRVTRRVFSKKTGLERLTCDGPKTFVSRR